MLWKVLICEVSNNSRKLFWITRFCVSIIKLFFWCPAFVMVCCVFVVDDEIAFIGWVFISWNVPAAVIAVISASHRFSMHFFVALKLLHSSPNTRKPRRQRGLKLAPNPNTTAKSEICSERAEHCKSTHTAQRDHARLDMAACVKWCA